MCCVSTNRLPHCPTPQCQRNPEQETRVCGPLEVRCWKRVEACMESFVSQSDVRKGGVHKRFPVHMLAELLGPKGNNAASYKCIWNQILQIPLGTLSISAFLWTSASFPGPGSIALFDSQMLCEWEMTIHVFCVYLFSTQYGNQTDPKALCSKFRIPEIQFDWFSLGQVSPASLTYLSQWSRIMWLQHYWWKCSAVDMVRGRVVGWWAK